VSISTVLSSKRTKLRGRVEKIIKSPSPREPERAQIGIEEADELYREIRVENVLTVKTASKFVSSPERR